MSRSLKLTSQKNSSHSFHPSARRQTVCRCDPPPHPPSTLRVFLQAGSRSCSSPLPPLSLVPSTVAQVMICGSQDWLATWGRHCVMTRGPVGVWLSRQRPLTMCCRAVPLGFHFCRESERKGTTSSLSFEFCRKHRCPCSVSGLYYWLLINDVYQHRRFMLAVSNGLSQTWITVITWMIDLQNSQWKNRSTASCRARQPAVPHHKEQFVSTDKIKALYTICYGVLLMCG